MKENQKKAFDFAADTTKQLITLSTAIITVTITFSKDLTSKVNDDSLWCVFTAWGLFILSIIFGIFTLMALTGSLQPLSKKNDEAVDVKGDNEENESFSINGVNVRNPSIIQIATFISGIIFTVVFGFKTFSASDIPVINSKDTDEITIIRKTNYSVSPSAKTDTLQIK